MSRNHYKIGTNKFNCPNVVSILLNPIYLTSELELCVNCWRGRAKGEVSALINMNPCAKEDWKTSKWGFALHSMWGWVHKACDAFFCLIRDIWGLVNSTPQHHMYNPCYMHIHSIQTLIRSVTFNPSPFPSFHLWCTISFTFSILNTHTHQISLDMYDKIWFLYIHKKEWFLPFNTT